MELDKKELDTLIGSLSEKGIQTLLSILNIYILDRSLSEIKKRIDTEDFDWKFETKMRGVAEFKQFIESLIKN